MKKFIFPVTLLLLQSIFSALFYVYHSPFSRFLLLVSGFLVIYFCFRRYKKLYHPNGIKFSKAIIYGLQLSAIWAVLAALISFPISKTERYRSFVKDRMNEAERTFVDQKGYVSPAEKQTLEQMNTMFMHPVIRVVTQVTGAFFFGMIYCVICAAIFRYRTPGADPPVEAA
jgi:hypothetical protein